ncbi:MAG: ATP-binding cassette domain-containing protein [Bdellovibrionales bacterium]
MFEFQNMTIGYPTQKSTPFAGVLNPAPLCFFFGMNGSGKTTLLKTLAGLLPPQSGNILFDGHVLSRHTEANHRPAYLPTSIDFDEYLTGEDVLDISDFQKSVWYKKSWLEKMALQNLLAKPLNQLSSGEQKRLMIVATLAHPSAVVLMDEPLSSLDWNFEFQLKGLIDEQIELGRKFIICNHDFNWALRFKTSQTWVIHQLSRLMAGETKDILASEKLQSAFHFRSQLADNPLDGTKILAIAHLKEPSRDDT